MQWLKKFTRAESGSVMPIVALGIFVLVGATGTAIDLGRVQIVQSRLQTSIDNAGLAAGASASTVDPNTQALNYFNAAFPANYLGSTLQNWSVTQTNNNTLITISVQAVVPTTFMQLFGTNSITVSASTQITKQSSGMELVLVLDNTGSMNSAVNPADSSTPKIVALQNAAATLLNTLYGASFNIVPNLWVGVVPFSQTVNIGTNFPGWMDSVYDATLDFGPSISGNSCATWSGPPVTAGVYNANPGCVYSVSSTTNHTPPDTNFGMPQWQGCVMARSAPYDASDDPPATAPFQAYDYPAINGGSATINPWVSYATSSHRSGGTTTYTTKTNYNFGFDNNLGVNMSPNALCPQPVLPMVAEKSTVLNEINSLTAGGSTLIDIGMAWGERMLSPRWQGLWGGEMNANSLPLAYHTPLMNKVLILMTDGMNSVDSSNFTAYGWLSNGSLGTTNNTTTADSTLDTRTLAVCTALKANGVIIYAIGFGTTDDNNPNNPTSVNGPLLQACVSNPSYYFLAPTNAQLTAAFQQIGDSLANLRVSQ